MATQPSIDSNVETFLNRALPHFISGLSVEDSMRAVLEDDARIAGAFFKRSSSVYFPTADEHGRSHTTLPQVGDTISAELSSRVYRDLRDQVSA